MGLAQRSGLPIAPATTLRSCSWPQRTFPSLDGSRLRFFFAMLALYTSLANALFFIFLFTYSRCCYVSCYGSQIKRDHSVNIRTHDFLCVCLFVCYRPIYSGLQTIYFGWYVDAPAGVTQTGGKPHRRRSCFFPSTFLLRCSIALIFIARRIQPFLSLVDREVECRVPTT